MKTEYKQIYHKNIVEKKLLIRIYLIIINLMKKTLILSSPLPRRIPNQSHRRYLHLRPLFRHNRVLLVWFVFLSLLHVVWFVVARYKGDLFSV